MFTVLVLLGKSNVLTLTTMLNFAPKPTVALRLYQYLLQVEKGVFLIKNELKTFYVPLRRKVVVMVWQF